MVRRRQLDDWRIEDEIEELNTELKNLRMDRRERNSGVPRSKRELADEEEQTLSKKINALRAKLRTREKVRKTHELDKIAKQYEEARFDADYHNEKDIYTEYKEKQDKKYKEKEKLLVEKYQKKSQKITNKKEKLRIIEANLEKRDKRLAKRENNYDLLVSELKKQTETNTKLSKQLEKLLRQRQ